MSAPVPPKPSPLPPLPPSRNSSKDILPIGSSKVFLRPSAPLISAISPSSPLPPKTISETASAEVAKQEENDKELPLGPDDVISFHETEKEPTITVVGIGSPTTIPQVRQPWTRGKGFWRCFISFCIALLLSAFEGSVTSTALPTISEALHLGPKSAWVATSFLLSSTVCQPLYGQLANLFGRKHPMMAAVLIFMVGSAICGAAHSGAVLIFGRVVQGLGTGGIDLVAELLLCDIVPPRGRGLYAAIKHSVFAVGALTGPLLGGVFAEKNWRLCFYINVPIGVIAFGLMAFWLKHGRKDKTSGLREQMMKIDYAGTGLLITSIILILYSLSSGGADLPWFSTKVIACLTVGFLGLIAFPLFEACRWCNNPIMPAEIFSNRTSAVAYALTVIHGFLTYGIQFYLPAYFQAVMGSSPSRSGLQILPCGMVIVVLAAVGGPLLTWFGKYRPMHLGGFLLMTLGASLCTTLGTHSPVVAYVMIELLIGIGSGIVVPTLLPAALAALPGSSLCAATGTFTFLRGTGSLFGVAIPGALFNAHFESLMLSITDAKARSQLEHGQAYQRASATFVGMFEPEVGQQISNAFKLSLQSCWVIFAVLAAVGVLLTFAEKQLKMRKELDCGHEDSVDKELKNEKVEKGEDNSGWASNCHVSLPVGCA